MSTLSSESTFCEETQNLDLPSRRSPKGSPERRGGVLSVVEATGGDTVGANV
uniref:Uncharacterized protein n=1 Tax=Arundo donax TaxID=35708 RepID=A0A0A9AAL4_ARUDO